MPLALLLIAISGAFGIFWATADEARRADVQQKLREVPFLRPIVPEPKVTLDPLGGTRPGSPAPSKPLIQTPAVKP